MNINTFKDYVEFTKTTAVYPKDHALSYLFFGLINEIGEFKNKVSSGATIEDMADELSDVCWYVAQLVDLLNIDVSAIDINKTENRISFVGARTQISQIEDVIPRICGNMKKYIRDKNEEKIEDVRKDIGYILYKLGEASTQIGAYNLKNVLEINIRKLSDRKERGVLKGDGDKR